MMDGEAKGQQVTQLTALHSLGLSLQDNAATAGNEGSAHHSKDHMICHHHCHSSTFAHDRS
jgi:hypothetical protein